MMNASKFFRTLLMILILLSSARALADAGLGGFADVCEVRPDLCSDDPAAVAKTKALRKKRLQEQKMRAPAAVAPATPAHNDSASDEVEPLPPERAQAQGQTPTQTKRCRHAGESFNLDADLPVCQKEVHRQTAPAPTAARTVHVKAPRKIVPPPADDELALDEELEKPTPRIAAKEKVDKEKDPVKDKTKREPAAVKLKDSISFADYERDNANNPALARGMYKEQTAFEYPSTIVQTPIGNVQISSDPVAGPATFQNPTTSSGVTLPPQQIPAAAPQSGGDASSNGQSVREGMDAAPAPGGNGNNR